MGWVFHLEVTLSKITNRYAEKKMKYVRSKWKKSKCPKVYATTKKVMLSLLK